MIKYICDYCEEEFFDEEEYEKHCFKCDKHPYSQSKSIEMWKCLLTVNLNNFKTSYKTFSYDVFEKEDRYITYDRDFCSEKLFCRKEIIEKIVRSKSEYDGVIMLEYKTFKLPIYEFIKPLFEEEVKKILQEKIDRLVEAKNNFKL